MNNELRFTTKTAYKMSHINLVTKEFNVIKSLQNYDKLTKYLPQNIKINKNILSYKFIKGEVAGKYLEDFGFKSGFFTREKFNEFIDFHYNLSQIKNRNLKTQAQLYSYEYIFNELTYYKKHNPDIISAKQWQQVFEKLKQNQDIFNDKNLVLSHFDLYPENVLITKESFKIIDWEGFALLPSAFIPAFFLLMFWREKIWRDYSIKRFYTKDKLFEKSFATIVVMLSVRFIYQIKAYSQINDTNKQALRWFYSNLDTYINQDEIIVEDIRFLITKQLISRLVNANNLGKYLEHKVYEKSFSNVLIFIKTSKGQYTLKLFNPQKTVPGYDNEIQIINHLRKSHLPVYNIIKGQTFEKGQTLQIELFGYNHMYYFAKHLRGEEVDRHTFSINHVTEMGKILAQIHSLGVVHGDFSKRNIIFLDNKVTGVLDLEYSKFVSKNSKAYVDDLAHSLVLLLISYSASYIPFQTRIDTFLGSYFSQGPSSLVGRTLNSFGNLLVFHAKNEREKYKNLNPQGDMKKYDKIVEFISRFDLKS